MKILILGYSTLCKKKIIPLLKKKFSKIKFCICSKSQKGRDINASEWYRNYQEALEKSELYSINLLTVSKSIYFLVKSNFILIFNKYI